MTGVRRPNRRRRRAGEPTPAIALTALGAATKTPIEIAKDNTDRIMTAIEHAAVKDHQVEEITELRRLISPEKPPQLEAHKELEPYV